MLKLIAAVTWLAQAINSIFTFLMRKKDRETGALERDTRALTIIQKEVQNAQNIRDNANSLPDKLLLQPADRDTGGLPSVQADLPKAGGVSGRDTVTSGTENKSPQPDLGKPLPGIKCNKAGVELIKRYEGFREGLYICPAGKLTIGFGHLVTENDNYDKHTKLTMAQGLELLYQDIAIVEKQIDKLLKTILSTNQYSAVVSFVYNIGATKFAESTLLRRINERDFAAAAGQFLRWVYAAGKNGEKRTLPGLSARRKAEQDLFLS